jgi:hypothetical protein
MGRRLEGLQSFVILKTSRIHFAMIQKLLAAQRNA